MLSNHSVLSDVFDNGAEERLDLAAERAAIASAQAGDQAAVSALMRAYAAALRSAVGSYKYAGGVWSEGYTDPHQADELRSSAVLGFMEAIHAFDASVHDRLAAVVTGYLADALASNIVSPVAFTVPSRTLKRFYGILREAKGNVYDAAALAPERNMRAETFFSVLSAVRATEGVEAMADEESGTAALSASARPLWDNVEPDLDDRIMADVALRAMDEPETAVVRLGYGFDEYEPLPDAEVGHRLGLSRPKVQRLRSSALTKARKALGVA